MLRKETLGLETGEVEVDEVVATCIVFPKTTKGDPHCIVFTEGVSRFVEAYPLTDREI
jgi:hypothetical protein